MYTCKYMSYKAWVSMSHASIGTVCDSSCRCSSGNLVHPLKFHYYLTSSATWKVTNKTRGSESFSHGQEQVHSRWRAWADPLKFFKAGLKESRQGVSWQHYDHHWSSDVISTNLIPFGVLCYRHSQLFECSRLPSEKSLVIELQILDCTSTCAYSMLQPPM